MTPTNCENYLRDVLGELLESARAAKADYLAAKAQGMTTDDLAFKAGSAQSYYKVIALLVDQLTAFGLDRQRVGLTADLDIDQLLL